MGNIGIDATIESADIVLMKDDFSKIPELVTLGLFILKIAKQDIIIWALLNIIGLSLVFTGVFGPTQAAAFNFLSDFIPLINSIRVFRWYFKDSTILLNKK
jgi:cation transport ATPase